MRFAPPGDVNLPTVLGNQPLKFGNVRTPCRERAWPKSWAMRFVIFAEVHFLSGIRHLTFHERIEHDH